MGLLRVVRHAALWVLIVVLGAAGCTDGSGSDKRTLDNTGSVPALRDSPGDADLDIESLVREQFDDAIKVFRSWDDTFEAPGLFLLDTDSSLAQACNGSLKPGEEFYCTAENNIYLDLGFLDDFARRSVNGSLRDGAVFAVIAHELGHAWEHQVGFIDRDPTTSIDNELFADCISGAVIAATYENPRVAVPLIQQAAQAAYSVGNDDWQNPDFHGTPQQRRDATLLGAEDGHSSCEQYLS